MKLIKGLTKEILFGLYDYPLILANALYFKGTWEDSFDVEDTKDGDFYLLNGEEAKVESSLYVSEEYGSHLYGSFEGFKVLKLQYHQNEHDQR